MIDHYIGIYALARWPSKCSVCGDKFTARELAVYGGNNLPLCIVCAWDETPILAGLLSLVDAFHRYYDRAPPHEVYEALKQRESDPKRLKQEIQKDYDSIGPNGPLEEFLKKQLRAALDGKDVETLKSAKRLFAVAKRGI